MQKTGREDDDYDDASIWSFDHYFCNSFSHITLLIELSVVRESSNRMTWMNRWRAERAPVNVSSICQEKVDGCSTWKGFLTYSWLCCRTNDSATGFMILAFLLWLFLTLMQDKWSCFKFMTPTFFCDNNFLYFMYCSINMHNIYE